MKTVWKFPISTAMELDLPDGYRVLHVSGQPDGEGGVLGEFVWVELDPEAPKVTRKFRVYGTGHVIPDEVTHVGTFMDAPFVWHLYLVPS